MARFLIFDTMSVNDSTNNRGLYANPPALWNTPGVGPQGQNLRPITPWVDAVAEGYTDKMDVPSVPSSMATLTGVSYPARLFGTGGDVRDISWEFWLTGTAGDVEVCWYQEFYNERATPFTWTTKHMPPLDPLTPWTREQMEVVANSGSITHKNIVRSVTMNSDCTEEPIGDGRIFPMTVHSQWVRLRVFSMTSLNLNANYIVNCAANPPAQRLRIYAIVGGYEQVAAMDPCASQGLLWDSSAVTGPLVRNPDGTSRGYIGTWPTW
jgi:hypothetical protein